MHVIIFSPVPRTQHFITLRCSPLYNHYYFINCWEIKKDFQSNYNSPPIGFISVSEMLKCEKNACLALIIFSKCTGKVSQLLYLWLWMETQFWTRFRSLILVWSPTHVLQINFPYKRWIPLIHVYSHLDRTHREEMLLVINGYPADINTLTFWTPHGGQKSPTSPLCRHRKTYIHWVRKKAQKPSEYLQ